MTDTLQDDIIIGTDQNDTLVGRFGCDTLAGGIGDDILIVSDLNGVSPNWRNDLLVGGLGNDVYVLEGDYKTIGSFAVIADYQPGEEIHLIGTGYSTVVTDNNTMILDASGNDVLQLFGFVGAVNIV